MNYVVGGFIFGLMGMFIPTKEVAMFGAIGGILIGGAVVFFLEKMKLIKVR